MAEGTAVRLALVESGSDLALHKFPWGISTLHKLRRR